jgi:hypothetical protein
MLGRTGEKGAKYLRETVSILDGWAQTVSLPIVDNQTQ